MEEQKKVYSIVGTVTIGTDEYRDLLVEACEARKEAEHQNSRYWEKYSECSKLESKVKELTEKLEQYQRYIKDNNEQDKLELWIVRMNRED